MRRASDAPLAPVIGPLPVGRDHEAAALFARAFADDPLFVYVQPDAGRRARLLPHLFPPILRVCRRWGAVDSAPDGDGGLAGVACWLAPGNTEPGLVRWLVAGVASVYWRIGVRGMRRFGAKEAWFDRHHRADMPAPHWYLLLLAVDSAWQGKGVGGALLSSGLARADATGRPCYLETESERNVAFYGRHGFRVLRTGTVGRARDGGPRVWTLRRDPPGSTTAMTAYVSCTPPELPGSTST